MGGLWLFIPCNGNPMRIYNPVNVASWLIWWVDFVTNFPKIILNLWNCWDGSVLCQVFFWCYVFSMFFLVFHIWKFEHFVLIINYLYIATCFWKNYLKLELKPHQTKNTQPFFHGGSPWATLILNNMSVCCGGPLLCPASSSCGEHFQTSLYPFLCYSFSLLFSYFHSLGILKMSNFPKI